MCVAGSQWVVITLLNDKQYIPGWLFSRNREKWGIREKAKISQFKPLMSKILGLWLTSANYTVKPVLNGHHFIVAFIERWSLNTGQNILHRHLWDITEWPLNTGGL